MSDFWEYANKIERKNMRVVTYGGTRSGKTHFAASWPRPLFILPANEGSEETIRGLPFPFKKVGTALEMNKVIDVLYSAQLAGQIRSYCETVVFDAGTHYTEAIEAEFVKRSTTKPGETYTDWHAYNAHIKHIKTMLWSLDCHVIVNFLDKTRTDKNNNVLKAGIHMPGHIADTFSSSVDILAYMEQRVGPQGLIWLAHIQKFGHYEAGTRVRGMPHGTYQNFNFRDHILPYIMPPAQPVAQVT